MAETACLENMYTVRYPEFESQSFRQFYMINFLIGVACGLLFNIVEDVVANLITNKILSRRKK